MKKVIIVVSSILIVLLLIVGGFALIPTGNEDGESGIPIVNFIQEKKVEKDIDAVSNFNVFLKQVTKTGKVAKNVIEAKEIIKEEGYEGNFVPKSKDNHYYFNNEDSLVYLVDDSKDNEIKIVYAEENVELKDDEIYRLDLEYFPIEVSDGYELNKNVVEKNASEVEVTLSSEENILPEVIEVSGAKLSGYDPETGVVSLKEVNNDVFVKPIPEYEIIVKLTNIDAGLENVTSIKLDEEFTLNYTAPTGYNLPQTVAVSGADFVWDYVTGSLTIKNPTNNVNITIVGQAIAKSNQVAPAAPTVLTDNIGTDKVTLTASTDGYGFAVYAISETNEAPATGWQESVEFTGLTSGKDYYFFVKFLGDSKYNESAVSTSLKVTTLKADQTAPLAPTAIDANVTATKVTLTSITTTGHGDVEYVKSETNTAPSTGWQSTTEFADLTPNKDYYFFARYKGDANYNASPASASLKVTTPKADQTAPLAPTAIDANVTATKVTLTAITTTGHGDVEYAKSETNTAPSTGWQSTLEFSGLTSGKDYYFFARYKGDANYNASPASASLKVTTPKADQTAPSAPTATSANVTATKVTLTAITTTGHGAIEYAKSETNTAPSTGWQSSTEFTGLTANKDYYFFARYKGDTSYNASPASASLKVTTPKADQTAPSAPTATSENITATKVTLTAITTTGHGDVEYAKSETSTAPSTGWQSSTVFDDLTAEKDYYFFARYKGDTTYNASPASASLKVTTPKAEGTIKGSLITKSGSLHFVSVTTEEGKPMPNVTFILSGSHEYSAKTDANGTAMISALSGTFASCFSYEGAEYVFTSRLESYIHSNNAIMQVQEVICQRVSTEIEKTETEEGCEYRLALPVINEYELSGFFNVPYGALDDDDELEGYAFYDIEDGEEEDVFSGKICLGIQSVKGATTFKKPIEIGIPELPVEPRVVIVNGKEVEFKYSDDVLMLMTVELGQIEIYFDVLREEGKVGYDILTLTPSEIAGYSTKATITTTIKSKAKFNDLEPTLLNAFAVLYTGSTGEDSESHEVTIDLNCVTPAGEKRLMSGRQKYTLVTYKLGWMENTTKEYDECEFYSADRVHTG